MSISRSRRDFVKTTLSAAAASLVPLGAKSESGPRSDLVQSNPASTRPFVMDVHVHIPDPHSKIRPETLNELYRPWKHVYGPKGEWVPRPSEFPRTVDDLIRLMDRDGVDVAVVMPSDHSRVARFLGDSLPTTTNDYVAEQIKRFPDRLIGICGHDPLRDQANGPAELERRVKQDGFKGMKLYPNYDQFEACDERLFPIYEKATELGVVLTFHTGWTPWVNAPMKYGNPELLDEVGIRYPQLKVNLAHIGGPSHWPQAVLVTARHPNFTMDVSSWCTYPPSLLVQMLNLGRDLVGMDRILFGSEHTLCEPGMFIAELQNLNLFADQYHYPHFEDEDIRRMLGANAARVYGIEPRKRV